ncbi:hypothetical protein M9458_017994, partial [Cirrhinus mrigala]
GRPIVICDKEDYETISNSSRTIKRHPTTAAFLPPRCAPRIRRESLIHSLLYLTS